VLRLLASYPQAKLQAAERACAPYIKQAFPNVAALSPAQRAQRRQQLIAFATCMRSHGINFPDPTTAAGNPAAFVQALQNLDTGSPAYKSVEPGCRQQALKAAGG